MEELMKRESFKEIWNTLQENEINSTAAFPKVTHVPSFTPRMQAPNNSTYSGVGPIRGLPQEFVASPASLMSPKNINYTLSPLDIYPRAVANSRIRTSVEREYVEPRNSVELGVYDNEKVDRKERRLEKNREAAKECRRKKKEYLRCLEERVRLLENQNLSLLTQIKQLKGHTNGNEALPPMNVTNAADSPSGASQGSEVE
eukprot:Sdes_comp20923_c0_seq1m18337